MVEPYFRYCCPVWGVSETSTRELRNTETDLRVPFLRTACGQKCFSFRGAKLWNGLDAKSKLTKNFKQVKCYLGNSRTFLSLTFYHWQNLFITGTRTFLSGTLFITGVSSSILNAYTLLFLSVFLNFSVYRFLCTGQLGQQFMYVVDSFTLCK